MNDAITTIYCLCDDFLKAMRHRDDSQVRLSTAEVMTVLLWPPPSAAATLTKTRLFLGEYGYMPRRISKSHLNRRLHAIDPALWQGFTLLAEVFKNHKHDSDRRYAVDSLPVPVCDIIRIRHCRL